MSGNDRKTPLDHSIRFFQEFRPGEDGRSVRSSSPSILPSSADQEQAIAMNDPPQDDPRGSRGGSGGSVRNGRRLRRRISPARPEELPISKPTRMESLLRLLACPSASRAIWHPSCLDLPLSEEASNYHYMLSTLMSGEPIPTGGEPPAAANQVSFCHPLATGSKPRPIPQAPALRPATGRTRQHPITGAQASTRSIGSIMKGGGVMPLPFLAQIA